MNKCENPGCPRVTIKLFKDPTTGLMVCSACRFGDDRYDGYTIENFRQVGKSKKKPTLSQMDGERNG